MNTTQNADYHTLMKAGLDQQAVDALLNILLGQVDTEKFQRPAHDFTDTPPSQADDLATKKDIRIAELSLQKELKEVELRLQKEINGVRAEIEKSKNAITIRMMFFFSPIYIALILFFIKQIL